MELIHLSGWVSRDDHLETRHGALRNILDTLDSDAARLLHRFQHSLRDKPCDHAHPEGEW